MLPSFNSVVLLSLEKLEGFPLFVACVKTTVFLAPTREIYGTSAPGPYLLPGLQAAFLLFHSGEIVLNNVFLKCKSDSRAPLLKPWDRFPCKFLCDLSSEFTVSALLGIHWASLQLLKLAKSAPG